MAIPLPVAQTLRRQHGVIERNQALQAGLSPHQLRHLIRTGGWSRLLPKVYLAADAALTWHTWAFAALVVAGPSAVLVGATAAAVRGWHPAHLPICLAVASERRLHLATDNICVHELDVPDHERVTVDGLTTTTRLRTAVDVAHLLPLSQAQQLLDRMLVLDVVTLDALTTAVSASRRYGSAQARHLVRSAADLAASEAERLAHRLLRAADLTGWQANYYLTIKGRSLTIDIAFVGLKIAIEIKGWAFHRAPDRARGDDKRVADLQLAGWLVLSFGWYDLVNHPEQVVAAIREAIKSRTPVR